MVQLAHELADKQPLVSVCLLLDCFPSQQDGKSQVVLLKLNGWACVFLVVEIFTSSYKHLRLVLSP
jgi:hypothetical protein